MSALGGDAARQRRNDAAASLARFSSQRCPGLAPLRLPTTTARPLFAGVIARPSRGFFGGALLGVTPGGGRAALHCQTPQGEVKTDSGAIVAVEGTEAILDKATLREDLRYTPYVARLKELLHTAKQGSRYIAYSSDVGESLRPVLPTWGVNLTYGIAGAYVLADVALAGHRKHVAGHGQDVIAATCLHALTFQGVASLALPAVIIHTIVHQAQHIADKPSIQKMPRVAKWGPSGLGLMCIPLMPYIDPPVERAIDALFDKVWPAYKIGGHCHDHGEKSAEAAK